MILDQNTKNRIPFCEHSPSYAIKPELITLICVMEFFLQRQLEFSSGVRCEACNKKARGSRTSEHLTGYGVDIVAKTSRDRIAIARAALKAGCKRVGVYEFHVHIGTSPLHPQDVLWLG